MDEALRVATALVTACANGDAEAAAALMADADLALVAWLLARMVWVGTSVSADVLGVSPDVMWQRIALAHAELPDFDER